MMVMVGGGGMSALAFAVVDTRVSYPSAVMSPVAISSAILEKLHCSMVVAVGSESEIKEMGSSVISRFRVEEEGASTQFDPAPSPGPNKT